jgi:hypothetical protein
MKATTKLRELLEGDDIIITPGVYDCLTARLAETTGFSAVKLLGNVTCASLLGLPDLGLIGLNEMANHAKNVAAAVDIPVMVDADTGYSGGPLGIARTIKEFERAGIAGVGIEDQVTPKKCALIPGGTPVVPIKEQVKKLQAAVEAKEDPDFVISARTDAESDQGLRGGRYRYGRCCHVLGAKGRHEATNPGRIEAHPRFGQIAGELHVHGRGDSSRQRYVGRAQTDRFQHGWEQRGALHGGQGSH